MSLVLDLAYLLAITLLLPRFVWQALARGKYRDGLFAKLFGQVPQTSNGQHAIWFHAVSVGEVGLLAPLIERIRPVVGDDGVILSTTTQGGYQLAKSRYPQLRVIFAPFDFSWAVRRAVARLKPRWLILTELELWPNLIHHARRYGARVAVINGRLSDRSLRGYQRIGWLTKRMLADVDLIAVQTDEYARRFVALGAPRERVHVTGSLKFDGVDVERERGRAQQLRQLAGYSSQHVIFLAGSTQAVEEQMALSTYCALRQQYPRLRCVLVPRHPERFAEVARGLDAAGLRWQRRSRLPASATYSSAAPDILLVDTVGELRAWWGTAAIAFVGGSFGRRGGQNMIEPAAWGCAMAFGPHTHNFRDVVQQLLTDDAATVVYNTRQLTEFVQRCLDQPAWAYERAARAQSVVRRNQGATGRTLALLERSGFTGQASGRTPANDITISGPLHRRTNRPAAA